MPGWSSLSLGEGRGGIWNTVAALSTAAATLLAAWYLSQRRLAFKRLEQPELINQNFKHGGELVAEALVKHGVKFIFTLIGGHISPVIVASKAKGVRIIDVRHEVNAVFAADAVSRLSDTPGVACVTAGPGLTNTVTAVKNAMLAQSPLILIGGATAGILKGRGALQDVDQQALFAPHVKWQVSIKRIRDIIPMFDKAFAIARSGTPGPVFIELPIDLLYPEETARQEMMGKLPKDGSIVSRLMRFYVKNMYLAPLFGGRGSILGSAPYDIQYPSASNSHIVKAFNYLKKAKKPVMVLGSQVVTHPKDVPRIVEAVESLGIPVYCSGMSRGLLGRYNSLQSRHKRGNALKEADLILFFGVAMDFRLGYGQSFPRKTPLISVNLDRADLYKNRTPTLPVLGDPGDFLIRFANYAREHKSELQDWDDWAALLNKRDSERDIEIVKLSEEPCDEYLNPLKVCQALEAALPENSILVADGGDFVATASYITRPRGPLTWLDPGVFGTLGVGAGFAIGAKLVHPDAQVWIIWGDGSSGYSLMEYDTCVRHNIPIVSLIGNDGCWAQIHRDQVVFFKDDAGCMLVRNDYHKMSEALGAAGFLLDSEENIDRIFQAAKETVDNGTPVVINALIGRTDFRKGSISV